MFWSKLGSGLRIALGACAVLVVVWAFAHVITRGLADPYRGTVRLTVVQWGGAKETATLQSVADEFAADYNTRHPDRPPVKVEVIPTADFDAKVFTMAAGGVPPDVFYVTDDNLSIWANHGMLHPLDAFIADDVQREGDAWLKDYYPRLLDWFKFDGTSEGRGPQYALPTWHSPFCMVVNVRLFERAGLAVPYDGWTWEEYDEAIRKISALSPSDAPQDRIYGASIGNHQYATRTMIWNSGGQLFGGPNDDDENVIRLGEPGAQAALKRIQRARWIDNTAYNPVGTGFATQSGGNQEEDLFCTGRIGVVGPTGYSGIRNIRGKTRDPFDVVPVPHIRRELDSASIGIAWAVAAKSKHPREAYELVRWYTGRPGQTRLAREGFILPALQSVANSPDFLNQPDAPPHLKTFVTVAQRARIPYWPRIKPFLGRFFEHVDRAVKLNAPGYSTEQAAIDLQRDWKIERHAPRNLPSGPRMHWAPVASGMAGIIGVAMLGYGTVLVRRWRRARRWRDEAAGLAFVAPWLLGLLIFTVGPMLFSLALSLTQWSPVSELDHARWAGISNYREMFTSDRNFRQSLQVTFWFSVLSVPASQVVALMLALLLNAKLKTIGFFRSAYFLPSLVGGVALATIGAKVFDNEVGLANAVLKLLHLHPINWFGSDGHVWALPAVVLLMLFGVGGSMVIYLAALKGVPPDLYESASLDGANAWTRFWRITFPMISPIVQFNVIMAVIGSFKVFDVVKVMTVGGPDNATLLYALQLYNEAFGALHMGYGSAMAWVLFGIIFVVTVLVLRAMRGMTYYQGLR